MAAKRFSTSISPLRVEGEPYLSQRGQTVIADKVPATSIEGVSNIVFEANCTAAESAYDIVYISGSGEVRQADASDVSTGRAVGFIESKSSTTDCIVSMSGALVGFSGLTPGANYFLSETPGQITTTAPTASGTLVVPVGKALSETTLIINIAEIYMTRA